MIPLVSRLDQEMKNADWQNGTGPVNTWPVGTKIYFDLWCYVSWTFIKAIYSEGSPRCVWGGHICQWTLKTMTWHLTPLHFSTCNCVISGDWAPASAIHPGPNRGDNNLRSKEATLYNTNYHSYSFIHPPPHRYSNYSTKKANIEKDPLLEKYFSKAI